jgi:hypothetical protein
MDDVLKQLNTEIQIADYLGRRRIEMDVDTLRTILVKLKEQPEIIHCIECKHWKKHVYDTKEWLPCMSVRKGEKWYCGSAERG